MRLLDVLCSVASASVAFFAVWTAPRTWTTGEDVTAAILNTHVRDNMTELRAGGIAIASQAANDFLYAASSTQIGRLAAVSGRSPKFTGGVWVMTDLSTEIGFPVGSVYEAVVATNPATLLGFGTWVAVGTGRVFVCLDSSQVEFDTLRETGGTKTHTLMIAEMSSHTHAQAAHTHGLSGMGSSVSVAAAGPPDITVMDNAGTMTTDPTTAVNQNAGSGTAHQNLQKYVVTYRWERTA